MKRLGGIFLIISLTLTGGCTGWRVLMAGEDAVTLPQKNVTLITSLEQRNLFLKEMEKRPVEFRLISAPQKSNVNLTRQVITDDEGEAITPLFIPEEGLYQVEVKYLGCLRFAPGADQITVLAVNPKQPVLVLDLDNTITNRNWFSARPEPRPYDQDTARVVQKLAQHYAVVYLSARPKQLHRRTRDWLKRFGFPDGPILLWYPDSFGELKPSHYKKDKLIDLRRSGINLAVGISNSEGDIKAYRKAGMEPILLGKKKAKGARAVKSWAEIEKLLVK
jgi:hypothetical protein